MNFMKILKRIRCYVLIKLNKSKINYKSGFSFGRGTTFYAPNEINIGKNVYIGKYCSIESDTTIGNDVLIGNHVGIIGRYDHDFSIVGTTIKNSPWIGEDNYEFKGKEQNVIIENDVWIGFGSIILSGVVIGRGSIIGAGSIVTESIPPYSICVGVPAKVISKRFDSEQIKLHEQILYKN